MTRRTWLCVASTTAARMGCSRESSAISRSEHVAARCSRGLHIACCLVRRIYLQLHVRSFHVSSIGVGLGLCTHAHRQRSRGTPPRALVPWVGCADAIADGIPDAEAHANTFAHTDRQAVAHADLHADHSPIAAPHARTLMVPPPPHPPTHTRRRARAHTRTRTHTLSLYISHCGVRDRRDAVLPSGHRSTCWAHARSARSSTPTTLSQKTPPPRTCKRLRLQPPSARYCCGTKGYCALLRVYRL